MFKLLLSQKGQQYELLNQLASILLQLLPNSPFHNNRFIDLFLFGGKFSGIGEGNHEKGKDENTPDAGDDTGNPTQVSFGVNVSVTD